MFEGLNWIIPMVAIFAAGTVGCPFVLISWTRFAAIADGESKKRTLKPLLAFSASTCLDFAACGVLLTFSDSELFQGFIFNIATPRFVLASSLVASLIFLLVALGLASRDAGAASEIVKWGSITSLAIEGIGCLLFVVVM